MQIIDFRDEAQKRSFDREIASDPHSFVQQSTGWAESVTPISGDEAVFCYHRADSYFIGASLYFFPSEFGNILVSNVQAGSLGCFSFSGSEEIREIAYRELIRDILSEADARNCMSVTVTSNPYAQDRDILKSALKPDAGMSSFVSVIPIRQFFDQNGSVLFRDYNRRSNLSRNIKKSRQQGFEFQVSESREDVFHWYEHIHTKRIRELEGSPLPIDLFKNLTANDNLADSIVFFKVTHEGKMIAGDFCVFGSNGNLDNFMMSTDSDYLDRGVNFFLVDQVLKWCFENEITMYNWQSSNPPHGGIFRFKEQWGSKIEKYDYHTKVLDRGRFENLFRIDIHEIMSEYSGHFVAPYKTLVEGQYGFFDKLEVNQSANIFTSGE